MYHDNNFRCVTLNGLNACRLLSVTNKSVDYIDETLLNTAINANDEQLPVVVTGGVTGLVPWERPHVRRGLMGSNFAAANRCVSTVNCNCNCRVYGVV